MKAIVYTEYGPPEVLQLKEVEEPVPQSNELLVRIHATTVNRTDCGFRKPEYGAIIRPIHGFFRPRRHILGTEFAGVIESVGRDVKTFTVGEQVFGLSAPKFGTHAEYICLAESGCVARKPTNMSYEEAAAVCDGLMLGSSIIKCLVMKKARTILINGASGSIGSACLQLAKHHGLAITAVCGTNSIELVRRLGAGKIIDYTRDDFTQGSQEYDAVIDAVGKSSFFRCKRLLKPGGLYFSADLGYLAQNLFLALLTPVFSSRRVKLALPTVSKKDIIYFKELIEAGEYRAVVDRCYPLDAIVEATRYVETGQKTGNVVITMGAPEATRSKPKG